MLTALWRFAFEALIYGRAPIVKAQALCYTANMLQPSEISISLASRAKTVNSSEVSAWLAAYTETVLAYTFAGRPEADLPTSRPDASGITPEEISSVCDKIIRLVKSSGRPNLVLFGLGNGALPAALLARLKVLLLSKDLPQETINFILCDQRPDQARVALHSPALRQRLEELKAPEAPLPPANPLATNNTALPSGSAKSEDAAAINFNLPVKFNLIVDTSPRALLLLLASLDLSLHNTLFYLNPCLVPSEASELRQTMQLVQRTAAAQFPANSCQSQTVAAEPLSSAEFALSAEPMEQVEPVESWKPADLGGPAASLSVLAILHPEEPQLEDFCRQIPPEVKELVIVWDSDKAVRKKLPLACPLLQSSRPLNGDFAAQRNFALLLCSGNWVLALDGDERLATSAWQQILQISGSSNLAACFLPRLTLYPDTQHFRMGYGFWPDLQLRLFKREPQVLFERPVHEILTGIKGPSAVLPHAPIWHHSYTLKNRAELQQRLQVFNQAAGREVHKLSAEYPHLPLCWHEKFLQLNHKNNCLLLP